MLVRITNFPIPTLVILVTFIWTNLFVVRNKMDAFVATEKVDPNQNNFVRYKWCNWGPWSRCSVARCPKGISVSSSIDGSLRIHPSLDSQDELVDPELVYCVVRTSDHSRRPAKVMIQELGRNRVPFSAIKIRYRKCCPSFGLLNIFRLGLREECRRGQLNYECTECFTNETVYLTRENDSDQKPLPFCARDSGSLQLAKILGSIAAAIILVCLLACSIRLIVKYAFRRRQDPNQPPGSASTSRSISSSQRRSRASGVQPHAAGDQSALQYLFCDRSERTDNNSRTNAAHTAYDLPPAYKDVVKLPWIGFAPNSHVSECHTNEWAAQSELATPAATAPNPISRPPHRFSCAIDDPEQLASSSQTLGPQNSGTPLPPSYEEVVTATSGFGRLVVQPQPHQQPSEEIAMEDRGSTSVPRQPRTGCEVVHTSPPLPTTIVGSVNLLNSLPIESRGQTNPNHDPLPPSIVQATSP